MKRQWVLKGFFAGVMVVSCGLVAAQQSGVTMNRMTTFTGVIPAGTQGGDQVSVNSQKSDGTAVNLTSSPSTTGTATADMLILQEKANRSSAEIL